MTRFWLRFTAVCCLLAALFFLGIGRMGNDDFFMIPAAVCSIGGLVTGILAGRCPHCGYVNRYGIWANYCSKCGGSMDD